MTRRSTATLLVLLLALLVGACREPPPGSTTTVAQTVASADDWCAGHGLPESACTVCNPQLVAVFQAAGDWCAEHGFPESACPTCNPVEPPHATAAATDWCAGHGLPESACTVCNPQLAAVFQAAGDWCAEHGFPESACPTCNPAAVELRPAAPLLPGTRVRFRSPEHEAAAGIRTEPAVSPPSRRVVEAPARIEWNRDALAEVSAPVEGVVRQVLVELGASVETGTPLFTIESLRVAELQAGLLGARERARAAARELTRQESLRAADVAAERAVEQARREAEAANAEVQAIRASLRLAGATETSAGGTLVLRAPVAGEIVRRPAVVGTTAVRGASLATVADTSTPWAAISLPERHAAAVALDQHVEVEVAGGERFVGTVTWVAPEVDPSTRAVSVRAAMTNPGGRLRVGQFGTARLAVPTRTAGAAVPRAALQRLGDAHVVFVRTGPGLYEPRVVEPGEPQDDVVPIVGDVPRGADVVTTGAFLLKTELTRESIGAGCCEIESLAAR